MKRLLGAASAFVLALTLCSTSAHAAAGGASTEAVPTCAAGDSAVWLNTSTKKYHLAGDPLYGATKHGKYLCKSAADASGAKMAKTHAAPVTAASPVANAMTCGTKHHRKRRSPAESPMPMPTATP